MEIFNKQATTLSLVKRKASLGRARSLLSLFKDQGSATLEFVALAIPLLVPLLLFSSQLSSNTSKNVLLHNALRESSHLFMSSNNDFSARSNVDLFLSKEFPEATISIICDSTPCLNHNTLVHFEITVDGMSQNFTFTVGSWQ